MPNARFAGIPFEEKIKIITQTQIAARLRENLQERHLPSTDGYVGRLKEAHDSHLRCAAVLIPLTYYEDEWHLLFTRRTESLNDHSGQVSFPGGRCDDEDRSPEETALREAFEEVGLLKKDITLLGRVHDVITVTNFAITPVVGVFPFPYSFRISTIEVERVFTMPLKWLANPKNYWQFQHPRAKYPVIAYHPFDGELLWGATARITVNFLKIIFGT